MITKLTGIIDDFDQNHVVLDVMGVGYYVHITQNTAAQLSDLAPTQNAMPIPAGNPTAIQTPPLKTTLYIEHIIKEDSQMLCGFLNPHDRLWFRCLLTVQGVGVRVALAILSTLTPSEMCRAILDQKKDPFTRISGIGPKLAGRIVLELKGKHPIETHMTPDTRNVAPVSSNALFDDAIAALVGLGYQKSAATSAINAINSNDVKSLEDMIRLSLKSLSKVG